MLSYKILPFIIIFCIVILPFTIFTVGFSYAGEAGIKDDVTSSKPKVNKVERIKTDPGGNPGPDLRKVHPANPPEHTLEIDPVSGKIKMDPLNEPSEPVSEPGLK